MLLPARFHQNCQTDLAAVSINGVKASTPFNPGDPPSGLSKQDYNWQYNSQVIGIEREIMKYARFTREVKNAMVNAWKMLDE